MKRPTWMICVVALSFGLVACNQSPDVEDDPVAADVERSETVGTAGDGTAEDGTLGDRTMPADSRSQTQQTADDATPARGDELPDGASPLPLLGIIGFLSLGLAAGVRILRG